jgi:ATP-binding cassette, subfamily B, bacterial CvaB/MchF/RaxB
MNIGALLEFARESKTPVILQSEVAECGLACLAMIASFHGHVIDVATIRRMSPISLKGLTLVQLIEVADKLGLGARPLRLELGHLKQLNLPAILHWDFHHFVVLTGIRNDEATINNPTLGQTRMTLLEVSNHFTGVAIELAPTPSFAKGDSTDPLMLRKLVANVSGLKGAALRVGAIAFALEIVTIASPLYLQLAVDNAVTSSNSDLLLLLTGAFAALLVFQMTLTAVRGLSVSYLRTILSFQMMRLLFRKLLKLPMEFFERRNVGEITSKFESMNEIQRTVGTNYVEAVVDGIFAVILLAMMLFYSVSLSIIVCTALFLYALVRIIILPEQNRLVDQHISSASREFSHILESIRGIQAIRLFARERQRQTVLENLLADRFNHGVRGYRFQLALRICQLSLSGIENLAVVFFGLSSVINLTLTLGMLLAFIAFKLQFTQRMIGLIDKVAEVHTLTAHLRRVSDIVSQEPEEESENINQTNDYQFDKEIEMVNVSFTYSPLERPVFRDVSFALKRGEMVCVVGPSGCGKTTFIKVLVGLLAPSSGKISIDGNDVRTFGLEKVRGLMGVVSQDDTLFIGSIADNISFFELTTDQQLVEHVSAIAGIHDEIMRMPMRYNTLVGESGGALSGGQKQRILLARALYKRPAILILDEATSNLDVENEKAICERLRAQDLTILSIAHRPEAMKLADRLFHLGGESSSDSLKSSLSVGGAARA